MDYENLAIFSRWQEKSTGNAAVNMYLETWTVKVGGVGGGGGGGGSGDGRGGGGVRRWFKRMRKNGDCEEDVKERNYQMYLKRD